MSTPWDRCSGDGWTPDPRPVPPELEPDYTPALHLAADIINGLPGEAQDAIWEAVDLHECQHCGRTYDSEISLMFCCNDDEERRRGIYRGSD